MFNPFERMVAMRYLRARRREGFISVIAGLYPSVRAAKLEPLETLRLG